VDFFIVTGVSRFKGEKKAFDVLGLIPDVSEVVELFEEIVVSIITLFSILLVIH
jgi:hypothetical protein